MTARTPFLSLFLLICAAFPAQLLAFGRPGAPSRAGAPGRAGFADRGVLLLPVILAVLVWYLAPASGVLTPPAAWQWWVIAVALGGLLPAIEIGLGTVYGWLAGARTVLVGLHRHWAGASGATVAGALVIAAAEEVIFRGTGLHLLERIAGWPPALAIGLTALLYGLNHLYFGWLTVAQKVGTGVLLGCLYDLSGHSLLAPLLAHLAQNLTVLIVLPRWAGAG
jgi:membrane protease YdiL (CAAX protease family)